MGGVSRYDGEGFTNHSTGDGLAHNWAGALLQDRQGHVWIGTLGGGLCRYDGATFKTFTTSDGLVHNWVGALLQDQEGHVWLGAEGGLSSFK